MLRTTSPGIIARRTHPDEVDTFTAAHGAQNYHQPQNYPHLRWTQCSRYTWASCGRNAESLELEDMVL